jgi:hypothetical protein
MHISAIISFRFLRLGLFGFLFGIGGVALAQTQPTPPLSADDVSWLFPVPTRAEDLNKLISMRDLAAPNKQDPVWPDATFQQFLTVAAAAQVGSTESRIGLPAGAQTIGNWFIAGVRIDGGAPGLSNDIRDQFGQSPEIRLIIQPVTVNKDGSVEVSDVAGHLIFDFVLGTADPASPGCLPRLTPDLGTFRAIVAELAALRTSLSNGDFGQKKIITSGAPLGVHPGLADPATAISVRQAMKSFLERHISGQRLNSMAIMGLPAGAPVPWIFLAMRKLPNGVVVPVPGPTLDGRQSAQMLLPGGAAFHVVPEPHTNNLNAVTCKNAVLSPDSLPIANRSGSSTAELFASPAPSATKTKDILDLIADPTKSHFFNTDCVSCHTETRRAMTLLQITADPRIDTAVLPTDDWNVRNFGWSPFGVGQQPQATVTRRTAAETAEVVAFINSTLLNK